jgi:hypothetical protein
MKWAANGDGAMIIPRVAAKAAKGAKGAKLSDNTSIRWCYVAMQESLLAIEELLCS